MTSDSPRNFYDVYWNQRGERSGDRCGYAPNFRRWMNSCLKEFNRKESLLEVGCGDCQFTKDLRKFTDNMTAIDISAEQIERNRAKHPDIDFRCHDLAKAMPFSDNQFQAIWCSEVIEHLSEPVIALQEMYRVLKPGGLLMVTVPYHGLLKNLLISFFKWDEHFDPRYPHLQYFTVSMISKLAQSVGFQKIQCTKCGMNKPIRDLIVPTNILMTAVK
jgi:ubiquinone/menaquinone biosynthesis C-methylase UbiE